MANFHSNQLVIAAYEQDMANVLHRITENLAANGCFDTRSVCGLTGAQALYDVVWPSIDACYYACFSGAPLPGSIDQSLAKGWDSRTASGQGMDAWMAALNAVAAKTVNAESVDETFRVEMTQNMHEGNPMSETAGVSMRSYSAADGTAFALSIGYATAWEPNSANLDAFFLGLPQGCYGVAFLDSDEYDGDDAHDCFVGTHHGGAVLHQTDNVIESGVCNREDLRAWHKELQDAVDSKRASLAELAFWTASNISECEEGASECEKGWCGVDRFDTDSFFVRHSIDWTAPSVGELSDIDQSLMRTLELFPYECEVTGQSYEGRDANIELLVPGAPVVLESNWGNPYFKHAAVHVFDEQGRRLANLGGAWNPSDDDRVGIACLLPHIRATAANVKPLGARPDMRAKHGDFTLHLELEPIDLAVVLDEVHALLKRAPEERTLCSLSQE